MYEGYLQLGGVEIANSDRVAHYVKNNLPSFPLRDCIECGDLREALGDPRYESPLVDDAPWVDESDPATYGFYGLYPLEITGVGGSTRQASVTESINDGGFVGPLRYATREIRVRGMLIARNGLSLESGLTWLRAALNPSSCDEHGGTCGGAKMCYYAACPTIDPLCFRETGTPGLVVPISSVTPTTSPTVFNLPPDPGAYTVWYRIKPTDGLVLRWGRRKLLSQDLIVQYGPAVSARTNYVPNPTFTQNLDLWSTVGDGTFTWVASGGIDDSPYAIREGGSFPVINYQWNGTPHASTSNAIDPDSGDVIATNLMTDPSFETPAGPAVMRTNIASNPSVETVLAPWDYNGCTISRDTTWAASGSYSIMATGSTSSNSDIRAGGVGQFPFGIAPGDTISFSATGHQTGPVDRTNIDGGRIAIYAYTPGAQITRSAPIVNAATTSRVGVTATIPANATGVMLRIIFGSTVATDKVWWDDFLVEKNAPLGPYFDGNTPDTADYTYDWTGTAGSSTSTQTGIAPVVVRQNLYPNPALVSAGGVRPDNSFASAVNATGTEACAGGVYTLSNVNVTAGFGNRFGSVAVGAQGTVFGVTTSTPVTVSVDVTGLTGTNANAVLYCDFNDPTGFVGNATARATADGRVSFTTSSWARPPDRFSVYLWVDGGPSGLPVTGGGASFSQPMIEVGGVAGPYFDGNTPDEGDFTYDWAGAANASTSRQLGVGVAGVTPAGAAAIRSAEWSNAGTRSLRLIPTTRPGLQGVTVFTPTVGKTYTAVVIGRLAAPITGSVITNGLSIMDPATGVASAIGNAAGEYEARITFTAIAGSSIQLTHGGTIGSGDVWWDSLTVVEVPSEAEPYTGPVFDGDTPSTIATFRTTDLVVPDQPTVVSFALRSEIEGTTTQVIARLRATATDAIIAQAAYAPSQNWERYSFTSSFAGACYLEFTSAGKLGIDHVMVETATVLLPYFDGSSDQAVVMEAYRPKDTSYAISWAGEPNLSASRMVWQAEGYDGTWQTFGYAEECDSLWRPSLTADAGELTGGEFHYSVREMIPIEEQVEPYERHYHDVTAIQGPEIIEHFPESRLGGAAYVVDFTLVAATPFAYSRTREILPLPVPHASPVEPEPQSHLPTSMWVDQACPTSSVGPILDPDCPVPPAPPRPPAVENPCIDDPAIWSRAWLQIPATEVSAWSQTLPTVVLSTGSTAVRQARVRFYPNPFDRSSSTVQTRVNTVPNPAYYWAQGGWVVYGGTRDSSLSGGPGNRPYVSVQATATQTPGNFGVGYGMGSGPAGTTPLNNIVTPGTWVIPSIWVNTSLTRAVRLRYTIKALGSVPGWVDVVGYGPTVTATSGVWKELVGSPVLIPANGLNMDIDVVNATTNVVAGEAFAATMAMCEQFPSQAAAVHGTYFDGKSTDAAGWHYYWLSVDANGKPIGPSGAAKGLPVDPCSYCSEFIVSYVPARTILTVDGMVQRAYASVKGGPERPASNLLYAADGGPMSWSELSCGIPYLVSIDLPPGQTANVEFGISLTRQE